MGGWVAKERRKEWVEEEEEEEEGLGEGGEGEGASTPQGRG